MKATSETEKCKKIQRCTQNTVVHCDIPVATTACMYNGQGTVEPSRNRP